MAYEDSSEDSDKDQRSKKKKMKGTTGQEGA
jgi:hypothetical protein